MGEKKEIYRDVRFFHGAFISFTMENCSGIDRDFPRTILKFVSMHQRTNCNVVIAYS